MRGRQSALNGPSRASRSGGFFVVRSTAHLNCPAQSRNGRPGSRGSRGDARAQARGACRREQGDEPDTDGRASSKEFATAARRQRRDEIFENGWPHRCGSTDAGGEDVGYFAQLERAGSNPAFDTRTGMRPGKGPHAARRSFSPARRGAALSSLTPISPVPQRTYQWPASMRRSGGGEDVCYFAVRHFGAERVRGPHAERRFARKGSNSIACSPPTLSTPRGEDRCYIVSHTRGRGFESRPVSCAPVAQRIERYPAGLGLPGSQQSPVPGSWSSIAGMIPAQTRRVCREDRADSRW